MTGRSCRPTGRTVRSGPRGLAGSSWGGAATVAAAVHGEDVTDPGRAFVGPDTAYLSPARFDDAVGLFVAACAALTYR